jgi:hypothetical protein
VFLDVSSLPESESGLRFSQIILDLKILNWMALLVHNYSTTLDVIFDKLPESWPPVAL